MNKWKETWEFIKRDSWHGAGYDSFSYPRIPIYLLFLWNLLYNIWYMFIVYHFCEKFGHKWEDDSYAGPESGCMAAHCKRCGYSFKEILY